MAILERCVGMIVVEQKALQLLSRTIIRMRGDVSQALQTTVCAVSECSDQMSDEELDLVVEDNECMPLVKLPHMMLAIRNTMRMRHVEVIHGLPHARQVVLCVAVSLSQVWGPMSEIKISTLNKYCSEAIQHKILDDYGIAFVADSAGTLVDSGIFLIGDDDDQFDKNDDNAKVRVGVQLDDVEIALKQSILDEKGFYHCLVDYVKRECPKQP